MKKLAMLALLLTLTLSARAQFEQGKWRFATALTGLDFQHETDIDRTSFGLEVSGGAFVADNTALLVHLGAMWNQGELERDVYSAGVGMRYYFDQVGIFVGANVNLDRYMYDNEWEWYGYEDDTKFSFGVEVGYAFFLSRTVTLEPSIYWNVDKDRSRYGLDIAFGFYF